MAEPSLNLGNGNWAVKSNNLLAYHKVVDNFYADELTFTRASTGTRVNADGLIEEAATNIARVDYTNNASGQLLLEPQRTNLITYSEDLTSGWILSNLSITADATTSPDGTTNADKLVSSITNTQKFIRVFPSYVVGDYSITFFAKKGGYNWVGIYRVGATINTFFDLENGVVVNGNAISSSIEDYGDGWYKCTAIVSRTGGTVLDLSFSNTPTTSAFVGDGTSGIYLWGIQLEQASYPTSYIPTSGTTVTRVEDTSSTTGLSSVIGQTEGTFFVDLEVPMWDLPSTEYLTTISDGSNNVNQVYIFNAGNPNLFIRIYANSVPIFTKTMIPITTRVKVAIAYKSGDSAVYVNGVQELTDSTAFTFSAALTDLDLNISPVGGYVGSNRTSNVQLYKTRLTNTELATLTTL